jgi:DNA repair exonuclease SbcCD nuclease subunit
MRCTSMSDLHMELSPIMLENRVGADVLILAGDIFVASKLNSRSDRTARNQFEDFCSNVSDQYKNVIVIAGNHEYYDGNITTSMFELAAAYSEFNNIHFLENDSIVIDGVTFIGATLWTDMKKQCPNTMFAASRGMSDYYVIKTYDNRSLTPEAL